MDIQWTIQNLLALASGLVAIIAIVFAIVSMASTNRLNRRFKKYKQIHSTADLEKVYGSTIQETQRIDEEVDLLKSEIQALKEALQKKVSTAKIVRYNAFSDTGSDLSYSVALLDDNKDGVVLSSIYGRDESRTYGKPVMKGTSRYPLTKEEIDIIQN